VVTAGFLYASDAAGRVLKTNLASGLTWFAVTVPLLPSLGAPAIGIGGAASSLVMVTLFGRQLVARTGASLASRLVPPTVGGLAGAGIGWLVSHSIADPLLGGACGAAAAEGILLTGLALVDRAALGDTMRLVRGALRRRQGAPAPVGS
jgi:hypothetical protein